MNDDPLRALLLRLARSPELQDRLIFDAKALLQEAGLSDEDQNLLLSADAEAINARVWPEGGAPRTGPILQIDIVQTGNDEMPVIRHAAHPVVTSEGDMGGARTLPSPSLIAEGAIPGDLPPSFTTRTARSRCPCVDSPLTASPYPATPAREAWIRNPPPWWPPASPRQG